MNPAPLTANVDIEFNNSCNGCCLPRRPRLTRAKRVSAHSATLKQIQDREIAEGKTQAVAQGVIEAKATK